MAPGHYRTGSLFSRRFLPPTKNKNSHKINLVNTFKPTALAILFLDRYDSGLISQRHHVVFLSYFPERQGRVLSFPDSSVLQNFPTTLHHRNAKIFTTHAVDQSVQQAIQKLIDSRQPLKNRISAPLKGMENNLFAKSQPLDSLRPKLRVTLGRAKRDGTFDWPVEEVINTLGAQQRGAPVAGLYGFGYRKSALGLIQEFFIFTKLLEGYLNGLEWLKQERDIQSLITVSFKLLRSLHGKGIVHMDFWANNVMVNLEQPMRAKAIDLENCFLTASDYLTEVLAFQFGFYYRREIYRFVIEEEYDQRVLEEVAKYEGIDRDRFDEMYARSKHENISRRARREIFHKGTVVTG